MMLGKIHLISFSVIATVFVLSVNSSLAANTPAKSEVYGSWEAMNINQGGFIIRAILIIKDSQVTFSNTCSFKEFSVLAEVSSPAVITGDETKILESKNIMKEHSPGFLQCRASVTAEALQYQVRNGKLVLTDPNKQETAELPRISR